MSVGAQGERVLVPVSALQHYSYCARQCALIHLEQTFDENIYTLRGRMEHERVDEPTSERRSTLTIERALPIFEDELGLVGRADVVEFHHDLAGALIRVVPVEYKHGKRHRAIHDDVQLCAQALCLEWMFGVQIDEGEIFHVSSKKRREVALDDVLRRHTRRVIAETRDLLSQRELPAPVADKRCAKCSLKDSCMPFVIQRQRAGGMG